MSLHASPSPEASARLLAQRRRSTVSSFIVALLSVTLLLLILGFIFIQPFVAEDPNPGITVTRPVDIPDNTPEQPKVPNHLRPNPSAPSARGQRAIQAETPSPVAIQIPETRDPDPSPDFGSDNDFGMGWDDGGKDGPGGTQPWVFPQDFSKRCDPQERMRRLLENGGTPRCEQAVVKGLDWLKATQAADGSWDKAHPAAMTGLALLAFLGHCETPRSVEYGDTVLRAIVFLVDLGTRNGGQLAAPGGQAAKHFPYEHAIATYALAEAATFCRKERTDVPGLQEITRQAGQFIIDNQHRSGGWDYGYDEAGPRGGDLSITAWQLQALKACHHTGLDFRNLRKSVAKALDFVAAKQDPSGGFGYVTTAPAGDTGGYHTLTGAGMLCLQMWDKGSASSVRKGGAYLLKNSRFDYNSRFADLYGHYYEAQAMMHRGGAEWKQYNRMFRDQVLDNQEANGCWKTPGGGQDLRAVAPDFVGNPHYRTCLCILMLETYYRFLPGTGGG